MFTDRSKAVLLLWIIYVISVLFMSCFRAHLFIDAFRSPAGKGLSSWLSFVMSNCEVVTFPLVYWVRCGALLYRLLMFAPFLVKMLITLQPQGIFGPNFAHSFTVTLPWHGCAIRCRGFTEHHFGRSGSFSENVKKS